MLSGNFPMMNDEDQNQGGGDFLNWIRSPAGRSMLYGAGVGLNEKLNNPNANLLSTAMTAAQTMNKEISGKEALGKLQKALGSLDPQRQAILQYAIASGDSKLISAVLKQNQTQNKPVHVGAGGTLVDPFTGKVVYQSPTAAGGATIPTKTIITQTQGQIRAIDNVTPLLNEIKDSGFPGQLTGKYIHPDEQAAYDANVASITDTLVAALKLPQTNESIHLVEKMVRERPFESRESYKKRINKLVEDLQSRRKRSINILKGYNIEGDGQNIDASTSNVEDGNNNSEVNWVVKNGALVRG